MSCELEQAAVVLRAGKQELFLSSSANKSALMRLDHARR